MCVFFRKSLTNVLISKYFSSHMQQRQKSYPFCDKHPTFTLVLQKTKNWDSQVFGLYLRHISFKTIIQCISISLLVEMCQYGKRMISKLSSIFTNHSTIISLPYHVFFLGHLLLRCSFLEIASCSWLRFQGEADSCENYLA